MDGNSGKLYSRFTALKDTNRGLQTWISVGGWSFTDPGPTRSAFSDMSSNSDNREKFIKGLISFMDNYGFDGVDLDWEYPQADDRGGVTADKDNYVSLVKEMRQAFGSKYGISMTLPTSYWYLQHFDLKNIQDSVDWFNLMSYDRKSDPILSLRILTTTQYMVSGTLNPKHLVHTLHLTPMSRRLIWVWIFSGALVSQQVKWSLVLAG
jgi:spore germination protein YaaH